MANAQILCKRLLFIGQTAQKTCVPLTLSRTAIAAQYEETGMTPNSTQTTAKIYQFPVGGRAGLSRTEPAKPMLDYAASGAGWYHQAAIEEAKQGTEH